MASFHRRHLLGFSAIFALFGARWQAIALEIGFQVKAVVNTVTMKSPDAGAPIPLETLTSLVPGTDIATAKQSCAELANADGSALVIGQRAKATIMPEFSSALLSSGAFRLSGAHTDQVVITTPHLRIEARRAEFVIFVTSDQTICGVTAGEIACTPIKKGAPAKASAGESIAFISSSFGRGVSKGVYQTGDIAADQGIEAARTAWVTAAPQ